MKRPAVICTCCNRVCVLLGGDCVLLHVEGVRWTVFSLIAMWARLPPTLPWACFRKSLSVHMGCVDMQRLMTYSCRRGGREMAGGGGKA